MASMASPWLSRRGLDALASAARGHGHREGGRAGAIRHVNHADDIVFAEEHPELLHLPAQLLTRLLRRVLVRGLGGVGLQAVRLGDPAPDLVVTLPGQGLLQLQPVFAFQG